MRTLTATQASRGFSSLLDSVVAGDEVTITRGGVPIVRITAVTTHTWGQFKRGMADLIPATERPDDGWADEITTTRALLTEAEDPWADD